MSGSVPRPRWIPPVVDLALACVGFGVAIAVHLSLQETVFSDFPIIFSPRHVLEPALLFWAAPRLFARDVAAGVWGAFAELFCLGAGVILIAQAVLQYGIHTEPLPLTLIAIGAVLSAALQTASRTWIKPRFAAFRPGVLMVGTGPAMLSLAGALRGPILAVLDAEDQLEDAIARLRPSHIVIGSKNWAAHIPPARLVELRQAGVAVRDLSAEYERVFNRILTERLAARDLLFSSAFQAKRPTMALQAVYSNVIGLLLLALATPFLLAASVFLWLFGGAGPLLDRVECVGFQRVPFERLSFRTRRRGGGRSWAGQVVSRLRLAGLPQLINVMRGEMALIGPAPVRTAFGQRLGEWMPFHTHRFSVKPGLTGWARVNSTGGVPSEPQAIEYDLYYIKNGSLALDVEILLRSVVS
jgi:lipopolysaccharide/colanic/teichoic acid biosynthesis glycosyltransferase